MYFKKNLFNSEIAVSVLSLIVTIYTNCQTKLTDILTTMNITFSIISNNNYFRLTGGEEKGPDGTVQLLGRLLSLQSETNFLRNLIMHKISFSIHKIGSG